MYFLVPLIMLMARKWVWVAVFLTLEIIYAYFAFDDLVAQDRSRLLVIFWIVILLLYCVSLIQLVSEFYKMRKSKR